MPSTRHPFVSIVTPFHNTEAYLAECIESVLNQTYQDWEYVLVNNMSTDGSADIAAHYARADSRIRLLHTAELLPQVPNYNFALRQISPGSKYCKLVQADDWIYPQCIAEMVSVAETREDVVLVGSYSLYERLPPDGDRPFVGGTGLTYGTRIVDGPDMLRSYLVQRLSVFGSPTCVMYGSRNVRERTDFYELGTPVEDMQACFDLLMHGAFGFVHQVLTFNRRQRGSIFWDASSYDSFALNAFLLAHRHGASLFTPVEYDVVLRRVEQHYYTTLASALLTLRKAAFWRYHASGLRSANKRILWWKVATHVPRALFDLLGNPKMTAGRLLAVLRAP
jgi:glycosyltransferase involved in cell wall biosynthesis